MDIVKGIGIARRLLIQRRLFRQRLWNGPRRWGRDLSHPKILPAESGQIQPLYNPLQGAPEIVGAGQHIRGVQQWKAVPLGVGLAEDTP